jgi:hypothetical protein
MWLALVAIALEKGAEDGGGEDEGEDMKKGSTRTD